MGDRGPRPTPSNLLKLRGSRLADRNPDEPTPSRELPDAPDWLDDDAAAMWDWLRPRLAEMRVGREIDSNALGRYCHLWARWRRAEDFIKKHGEVYPLKNDDGSVRYLQQYPQVSIAHKLAAQLSRLEQEFGLTPSARTNIKIEDPKHDADRDGTFARLTGGNAG